MSMDKKLRETTNLCVEIINSKRQVKGKTWSRGTNSRLPIEVNAMLNLSNIAQQSREISQAFVWCQ